MAHPDQLYIFPTPTTPIPDEEATACQIVGCSVSASTSAVVTLQLACKVNARSALIEIPLSVNLCEMHYVELMTENDQTTSTANYAMWSCIVEGCGETKVSTRIVDIPMDVTFPRDVATIRVPLKFFQCDDHILSFEDVMPNATASAPSKSSVRSDPMA